jgi:signal transduction histidine kinase
VQTSGSLQAIIYLNQCTHIRHWTRDDQKLAQAVADQLAISIQQGHLYAQSRQQAQESAAQAKQLAETLQALQQTQAQLIQSEKMSSLGQMVAGIAHEINNPITFIYGNIPYIESHLNDALRLITAYQTHYPQATESLQGLIEEVEPDFLIQDVPRILMSMRSGAGRIREIVASLRSFSRLDEAHCKVVNLHDGLESTLSILKTQIPADVQLCRQYGQLPPIECFPSLLNQVFLHLLKNALDALELPQSTPKTITITTEASLGDRPTRSWVTVTITDNGGGIDAAIQPKIFDPFFTTKEIGQGCGLGLAISYQAVVHQHRGSLSCHSTVGQGSTFTVKIPVGQPYLMSSRNQSL